MNLEIQKSLFDKEIKSATHNPAIVINKQKKKIKDKVQELINTSKNVDIAVSYAVWSGLSLIHNDLKRLDKDSRIIVTTEGYVTDPKSLKGLMDLPMQSKVYVPSNGAAGFHLKTYLGEDGDGQSKLLVGSSNISFRAFSIVHEMAIEVNANTNGLIVQEYRETFNNLWNDKYSKDITEEFIEAYTLEYKKSKELSKKISEFKLENEIKPNYMQQKALEKLGKCRKENDRGLVVAATGTGKTYLSAFDVKNANASKVLFLVHNRLILTSAIETFKKVFKDKNILELKSSHIDKDIYSSDLIFTTDKTASTKLYKEFGPRFFDYIIYDEAHKIGKITKYQNLIEWFNPKFSLGITATPERSDDPEHLFKTFKHSVPYEIRLLDAMDHELICPFTYYGYDLDERLLGIKERFDCKKLSIYLKRLIMDKGHYGEKLKGIIFCRDIKEANELSSELNNIGIVSISANEKGVDRERLEECIENLKSDIEGTLEVICVVNKFNEGVDIPDINTIIMLRNTTSSIVYLQQLGRGLRKTHDPHKYVTVFDIIGNSKNNYSIAEVLTGNTTMDKRKLYAHANKGFKEVSPFINVEIEKEAMEKIVKSISNNFKVETRLKEKFRDELYRFSKIPSLLELYNNPNFKELELLQLLTKNFYDPFMKEYFEKYETSRKSNFLSKLFKFITQFVFRAYSQEVLREYAKVLDGRGSYNITLIRTLLNVEDYKDNISTATKSDYYRKGNDFPKVFLYKENKVVVNSKLLKALKEEGGYELYLEHIELIEYLSNNHSYKMKNFDLLDKADFLFNSGSKNCYINGQGELPDEAMKKVYCPITITVKDSPYSNYIKDENHIVYLTQGTTTFQTAKEKMSKFINEKYEFCICANFPHLKYSTTSFFNMGKLEIIDISEVIEYKNKEGKIRFNHEITLKVEETIPLELMQYNSL